MFIKVMIKPLQTPNQGQKCCHPGFIVGYLWISFCAFNQIFSLQRCNNWDYSDQEDILRQCNIANTDINY